MKNKQIVIWASLILLLAGAKNYAQQDLLADAKERISRTNDIIGRKGYKWKAGLTSMSLLSKEQFKKRCGIIADTTFDPVVQEEQGQKLYQEWKRAKENGLRKALSIHWQDWMSEVESQGECGNCWAHSAAGVTEGLLHYSYGQNINIDLDEMEITDDASCAYGCEGCSYEYIYCGLWYIKNYEVCSENYGQFPNRSNAYYSIASYSTQSESISAIETALNSSPVLATMSVWEDFQDYSSGIYEHTSGNYLDEHAIVIVDYGNEGGVDYWLCKNSWGEDWGEEGYFKIKYGECGIDSYGSFVTATVNSSSFASFAPQFFSSVNDAVQTAKSDEYVYVASGTYIEDVDIDENVTIEGSGSPHIRGSTDVSSASATLKDLYLEAGSLYGHALGIYNGTATLNTCYVVNGPYTGAYGIWCSSSALLLRYGSVYATSTSSNTSILLINPGSSSYIRDCMIKPGNGIAISGTADGYAQDCDIVTYYKDSGYDINAYLADDGTFELVDNNYGNSQDIYDPEPYHVSGDAGLLTALLKAI